MSWTLGLNIIESELGFSLESIILLILVIGGLIFFAKGWQFGLLIEFFLSAISFMFAYANNVNFAPSAVVMMILLVLMTISLYINNQVTHGQGLN